MRGVSSVSNIMTRPVALKATGLAPTSTSTFSNRPFIYIENSWADSDTVIINRDFQKTNMIGAFLLPDQSGNVIVHDGLRRILRLYPQMKYPPAALIVSIGGATASNMGAVINDATARANMVESIRSFVASNPSVSGVDIDYEFPMTVSEKDNLTAFARELRSALGPNKTLTLAVSPGYYVNYYDFLELNKYVDHYIYMGYDFGTSAGANGPLNPRNDSWVQKTLWPKDSNSPIVFSKLGVLNKLIELGAPRDKLVVAFPGFCGDSTNPAVNRKPYRDVVNSLGLETLPVDSYTKEVIVGDTTCPSTASYRETYAALKYLNITTPAMWEGGYDLNNALLNTLRDLTTDVSGQGPTAVPTQAPSFWSPDPDPTATCTETLNVGIVIQPVQPDEFKYVPLAVGSSDYTIQVSNWNGYIIQDGRNILGAGVAFRSDASGGLITNATTRVDFSRDVCTYLSTQTGTDGSDRKSINPGAIYGPIVGTVAVFVAYKFFQYCRNLGTGPRYTAAPSDTISGAAVNGSIANPTEVTLGGTDLQV